MFKNKNKSILGMARHWLVDLETVENFIKSKAWFWLVDIKTFEKPMRIKLNNIKTLKVPQGLKLDSDWLISKLFEKKILYVKLESDWLLSALWKTNDK